MESLKISASFNRPAVIAVGASTGGPQALLRFFSGLRDVPLSQPFFVTQHMAAPFTGVLASSIAQHSGRDCHEAVDGEIIMDGCIYLAPGNRHMKVSEGAGGRHIRLSDGAAENFCRPAIDPMLRSLVRVYGGAVMAIIFTGMGSDGLAGCRAVHDKGGWVLLQDKASSVVWSMPGAVAGEGIGNIVALQDMAAVVARIAEGS